MSDKKVVDGIKKKLWKMINDIDYSVEDYEYRGDEGDYTPSEQEEELINDYTQGLLEEIVNALANKYRKLGLFTLDDIEIDVGEVEEVIGRIAIILCAAPHVDWINELAKAIADKKPILIKK